MSSQTRNRGVVDDETMQGLKDIIARIMREELAKLRNEMRNMVMANNNGAVVRKAGQNIPKFGGDGVKGWLFKIEQFFEVNNISNESKDVVVETVKESVEVENEVIGDEQTSNDIRTIEVLTSGGGKRVCDLRGTGGKNAYNKQESEANYESQLLSDMASWLTSSQSWGVNYLERTGNNESYNIRNIQEAYIVMTNPKKFDLVIRFGIKDGYPRFFYKLHLLSVPREAALDAIVTRIKMVGRSPQNEIKTCFATISNIEDLAKWLMVFVQ
ncbi:hypothetical protein Tco_1304197 [Tanacetum coccineum]